MHLFFEDHVEGHEVLRTILLSYLFILLFCEGHQLMSFVLNVNTNTYKYLQCILLNICVIIGSILCIK